MKRCSPIKVLLTLAMLSLFAAPAWAQSVPAAKPATKKSQPAPHSLLDAARAQLAKSDLDAAEHTLWQVLNSDANNPEALELLAVVRGRQQRYAEAESLFRRVVQLGPKSPSAHVNLAGALVVEDKIDEAVGEYKQAQVLAPRNWGIRIELARLLAGSGNYGEALANLESVPKASLPLAALPLKAGCLLALGRIPEALALAPEVKASPAITLDMAEVFVRSSLADPALKCLADAAPGLKPLPARFYYLKGKALLQKEQRQAAMENFQKALTLDPKDSGTLIVMAEMYADQHKHAESFAMLERAHALDPDAVPVLRHLIVEGVEAGKKQAVLNAAAALAEKSPDNPEDLYLAGAAFMQEGDALGAGPAFEKYLTKKDNDARAWLGLGMSYSAQKRSAEARSALERCVQIDPKIAESYYQLGLLSGAASDFPAAIQQFEHAIELQPKHFQALSAAGTLYLQGGQLEKAEDVLRRAEAIDASNAKTEYDLGQVLNKLGKRDEARERMDRFQKLRPAPSGSPESETPANQP